MIFISNAGNLKKRNDDLMNHPDSIKKCLDLGLNVRVDVKFLENNFFLINYKDKFLIETKVLEDYRVWCQAADIHTLSMLSSSLNINCFYLKKDKFTITSKGFVWNYDKSKIVNNSVFQIIDHNQEEIEDKLGCCYGICSDEPEVLMSRFRI